MRSSMRSFIAMTAMKPRSLPASTIQTGSGCPTPPLAASPLRTTPTTGHVRSLLRGPLSGAQPVTASTSIAAASSFRPNGLASIPQTPNVAS